MLTRKKIREQKRRAFTLIELLVVIAIIAILAAILFPVFAKAKDSARRMTCVSNQNQIAKAIELYCDNNDDSMPQSNEGNNNIGWGFGSPDVIWGQNIQPYTANYLVFRCPADPEANDQGLSKDPYERPVGRNHPDIYYFWMSRSSVGLNYDFLSPWITGTINGRSYVGSHPTRRTEIASTSKTILFADSIWYRNVNTGRPEGGGNWVIEAPCVRDSNGQLLEPMSRLTTNPRWQNYGTGWIPNPNNVRPYSWLEYGGIWPWHFKRVNVTFCDSHVKSMSIAQITAGCDVRRSFGGPAYDTEEYLWDLR